MTEAELLQATLAEVVELAGLRIRQPGDFTVAEFVAASGLSDPTARRRLNALEAQGVIEGAWSIENGKRTRLFRRVNGE